MQLAAYLRAQGETASSFGRQLGVSYKTIGRYCRPPEAGGQIPRYQQMRAIYVATGGRVQPNDFYGLPPLEHEEKAA